MSHSVGRTRVRALMTAVITVLSTSGAWAETACLEDGKPPPIPLIGNLTERILASSSFPAVPKGPFYTLELDQPVCLNGSFSESVVKNIRSVHVYSKDPQRLALLKKHRSKRVSVQFVSVFEEHTAHHRRPMVGEINTITRLRPEARGVRRPMQRAE